MPCQTNRLILAFLYFSLVIKYISLDRSLNSVDPPNRRAVEQIENMYYVYILKSLKDNKLYVGYSTDLKQRVNFHNEGLNKSTKFRRPLKLIYYEAYLSENDARKRELFLKSGRGREIIKKQLENTLLETKNLINLVGDCSSTR